MSSNFGRTDNRPIRVCHEERLLGFIYITKFKSKYTIEKRIEAYITVLQDAYIKKHKTYIDF
jgi:hypothetical protein